MKFLSQVWDFLNRPLESFFWQSGRFVEESVTYEPYEPNFLKGTSLSSPVAASKRLPEMLGREDDFVDIVNTDVAFVPVGERVQFMFANRRKTGVVRANRGRNIKIETVSQKGNPFIVWRRIHAV